VTTNPIEESGSSTSSDVEGGQKYHVLMELGRGGTAVVSAGIARGIGGFSKLVVLKNIKEDCLSDRETVKMFVNEARLSARMNHPNIVQVYEVYRSNKLPVIVMEYLDGQSMAKVQVRAFQAAEYTVEMAVAILCRVLAGLGYAHTLVDYDGTSLRIVHRDVSPHNVMLTYDGQVKLVDFGIAKLSSSTQDTKTGVIKGKIGYMAPEQLEGDTLDQRGDLFAVGVMLWEAIARRRLWGSRGDAEIVRCLVLDDIPSLRAAVPNVDAELERICTRALAAVPDERYATAAEFQADLEAFLSQRSVVIQQQDIAELVCNTCAELRAASQQRLKAELAKFAASSPGWEDALRAFDDMRTPLPESSRHPPAKASRWLLVVGSALITLASAAAAYGWLVRPSSADPELPVSSNPAELAASGASAPEQAERVRLRVAVTPESAALYLDDQAIGSGNVSKTLAPDQLDHELRAEAPGFEPLRRRVRLDADLDLKLTLQAQPEATEPDALPARAQPRPSVKRPPPRRPVPPSNAAPARPSTPAVSAPAPASPNCSPPYYIGADGLKHYRRECL
jgi:serine/threonine-protein kinase